MKRGESQSPAKRKLSKKAQAVSWEARSCFDISRMAEWQDGRTKDETWGLHKGRQWIALSPAIKDAAKCAMKTLHTNFHLKHSC